MRDSVWLSVVVFFWALSWSFEGQAFTPYKRTLEQKKGAYLKDGVFTGGQVGKGTSLLGVRRTYSERLALERVILDLGDHQAKGAVAEGYFQASLDIKNMRIVTDLSQLRLSRLSEAQLQQLFRNSPLVSSVSFTQDPEDQTGTMVLNLKAPAKLEVFRMVTRGKPTRLVLDIKKLKS